LRTAEATEPLTDGEIEALFAPVAGSRTIALAVSGGADSLALLDAIDRWRKRAGRPEVVVLTVDHGLRPESAREAKTVVKIAKQRGMRARLLAATGPAPKSDIEAEARRVRYRLLLGAAREAGASHLLLAHHQDDQAETFLIRLQRGSGVFGLAAMRPMVESDELMIFRPFLEVPRSRLAATTAAAGLEAVDDPMNSDPRFLRARIRRIMPTLAAVGIGPEDLAMTAARFATAAAAIDAATDSFIEASVVVSEMAVARIPLQAFRAEPEEIRLRFLVRMMMAIGGDPYPPRYQRLKALHAGLVGAAHGRLKRTLSGVVAEIRSGFVLFYREAGRAGLPEVRVGPGYRGVWDRRFHIHVSDDAPADLVLGALGEASSRFRADGPNHIPPAALWVQPAIRRKGKVVAVPTIGPAEGTTEGGKAAFSVTAREVISDRLADPARFPTYHEP